MLPSARSAVFVWPERARDLYISRGQNAKRAPGF